MVKPQWLRTLRKLAQLKNFTRAAEQLNLTQAAVSQHIRQLETQYGELIIRNHRSIEFTPAGKAVLEYANELDNAGNRLTTRLAEFNNEKGEVSIICPGSIGLVIYPLLLELQLNKRDIAIKNKFAPDSDILDAVLNNHYEVGLMSYRPDDPKITVTAFCHESLELIIPASSSAQSWPELLALGFIDHPDGKTMATRLLSRLYSEKFSVSALPVNGFSNQISLILEPVSKGLGFTVLPKFAREAFHSQHKIKSLNHEVKVKDTLWLIHRAEWPLSAKAKIALNYLAFKLSELQISSGSI